MKKRIVKILKVIFKTVTIVVLSYVTILSVLTAICIKLSPNMDDEDGYDCECED